MSFRTTFAAAVLLSVSSAASAAPGLPAHLLVAPAESAHASSPGMGVALDFSLPAFARWPQFLLYGMVRNEGPADPFRHLTGSQQFDADTGQVLQIKPLRFGAVAFVIDPEEIDPRGRTVEPSRFSAAVGLSDTRSVLPGQMARVNQAPSMGDPFELLAHPQEGAQYAPARASAIEQDALTPTWPGAGRDADLCPFILMRLELGSDDSAVPPSPISDLDAQACLHLSADPGDNDPDGANRPLDARGPPSERSADPSNN